MISYLLSSGPGHQAYAFDYHADLGLLLKPAENVYVQIS